MLKLELMLLDNIIFYILAKKWGGGERDEGKPELERERKRETKRKQKERKKRKGKNKWQKERETGIEDSKKEGQRVKIEN
jgi:hypothetical protein